MQIDWGQLFFAIALSRERFKVFYNFVANSVN